MCLNLYCYFNAKYAFHSLESLKIFLGVYDETTKNFIHDIISIARANFLATGEATIDDTLKMLDWVRGGGGGRTFM